MTEPEDIGTMDFIEYLDALLAAPTDEARSEILPKREAERGPSPQGAARHAHIQFRTAPVAHRTTAAPPPHGLGVRLPPRLRPGSPAKILPGQRAQTIWPAPKIPSARGPVRSTPKRTHGGATARLDRGSPPGIRERNARESRDISISKIESEIRLGPRPAGLIGWMVRLDTIAPSSRPSKALSRAARHSLSCQLEAACRATTRCDIGCDRNTYHRSRGQRRRQLGTGENASARLHGKS
jgi:hypothetical protein